MSPGQKHWLQRCPITNCCTDTYKRLIQVITIALTSRLIPYCIQHNNILQSSDIYFIQPGLINFQISLLIFFKHLGYKQQLGITEASLVPRFSVNKGGKTFSKPYLFRLTKSWNVYRLPDGITIHSAGNTQYLNTDLPGRKPQCLATVRITQVRHEVALGSVKRPTVISVLLKRYKGTECSAIKKAPDLMGH